jgi:hypothetical protein
MSEEKQDITSNTDIDSMSDKSSEYDSDAETCRYFSREQLRTMHTEHRMENGMKWMTRLLYYSGYLKFDLNINVEIYLIFDKYITEYIRNIFSDQNEIFNTFLKDLNTLYSIEFKTFGIKMSMNVTTNNRRKTYRRIVKFVEYLVEESISNNLSVDGKVSLIWHLEDGGEYEYPGLMEISINSNELQLTKYGRNKYDECWELTVNFKPYKTV